MHRGALNDQCIAFLRLVFAVIYIRNDSVFGKLVECGQLCFKDFVIARFEPNAGGVSLL